MDEPCTATVRGKQARWWRRAWKQRPAPPAEHREGFILAGERGLRPASERHYSHHLRRFEAYLGKIGVQGLQELSPALLSAFVAERSVAGLAKTSVRDGCGVLRVFLRYAHRKASSSRLTRNNAEWYRLLELATLVGTLIGDADGIHDPRTYNDHLLLGLRGMLSEAEPHLLKLRLDAGRMRQVERGAYRQRLPTGLTRLPDGRVTKDPDQQVQHVLALVFDRFAKLRSCQKVLRSLRDDRLLLPRLQMAGPDAGRVLWRKPSDAAVYEILTNPAYAGAFVYGRHGPRPIRRPGRRTSLVKRRLEEWSTSQRDAYPQYITWEEYVANQARLADNAHQYNLFARGAPRDGVALLVDLATCGRCGRQMRVRYKPQPRYVCTALCKAYGESACVDLDGDSVDDVVVQWFFEAIQPAELDLLEDVLTEQHAEHPRLAQQYADRVTRATYEARLAQRQFEAVDPDNRLVAAELERRWELALRALAEAREAVEHFAQQPPAPGLDPALH